MWVRERSTVDGRSVVVEGGDEEGEAEVEEEGVESPEEVDGEGDVLHATNISMERSFSLGKTPTLTGNGIPRARSRSAR